MEPLASTSKLPVQITGDPFVILLEGVDPEVAGHVRDYREVKTIANISLTRYRARVKEIWDRDYIDQIDKSKFGVPKEFKALQKRVSAKPKPRGKPTAKTPSTPKHYQSDTPTLRRRRSLLIIKTSTPLASSQRTIPKTVDLTRRKRQQELDLVAKRRRMAAKKIVRDINLKADKLTDLIPPDVDALDLEMDKLLLATPEADESDTQDSVSCMSSSSSESFFTCSEIVCEDERSIPENVQIQREFCSRPGLKLDRKLIEPMSRDRVASLPRVPLFSCDNPKCGFTTSDSRNIRLHYCTRS